MCRWEVDACAHLYKSKNILVQQYHNLTIHKTNNPSYPNINHALIHPSTQPNTHPLVHPLTRSLIYLLTTFHTTSNTHPLIHPFTPPLVSLGDYCDIASAATYVDVARVGTGAR